MPTQPKNEAITFETTPFTIESWVILQLPESASTKLPSRGQAMVQGTINGVDFQTPLEPDGKWSHWFRVSAELQKAAHIAVGDRVKLVLHHLKTWPEPDVPADLQRALAAHPRAHDLWKRITPMARWEWMRWIRATAQSETRERRIEVACSKLIAGERRPCCWNRALCTEPLVSKNGVLRDRIARN